jgi:hypothetical protein
MFISTAPKRNLKWGVLWALGPRTVKNKKNHVRGETEVQMNSDVLFKE